MVSAFISGGKSARDVKELEAVFLFFFFFGGGGGGVFAGLVDPYVRLPEF